MGPQVVIIFFLYNPIHGPTKYSTVMDTPPDTRKGVVAKCKQEREVSPLNVIASMGSNYAAKLRLTNSTFCSHWIIGFQLAEISPASFDGEAFDASMTLKAFAILGFHNSGHFFHFDE